MVCPYAYTSAYNNAWPGTGGGIYGWDDLASENDLYDGQVGRKRYARGDSEQMDLSPLTMEGIDDAAVSQNNFAVRS